MKERAIIFSGNMVKAILEGHKSQTRRVRGLGEVNADPIRWRVWGPEHEGNWAFTDHPHQGEKGNIVRVRCPYGQKGDRLYVKETWSHDCPHCDDLKCGNPDHVWYRANESQIVADSFAGPASWRSPLFMPRWASRITLEIVGVRVERVQQISELDCEAELGAPSHSLGNDAYPKFAALWDTINAARGYSWATNPWVFVIEFRKVNNG